MPEEPDATAALLGLFPAGSAIDPSGELLLGGCRASDLAVEFGTPAMVIDEVALRDRARRYATGLHARWTNSTVVWASKSLPCTAVYRVMSEEGLGIDVSGGGEIMMALAAGADPQDLVLHGNAKTDEELGLALSRGVGTVVIDGFDDIARLERLASNEQRVLIRVTPGISVNTHPAISTAERSSKFGLAPDDARRAIELVRQSKRLRLDGLHVHIGSQVHDSDSFVQAIEAVAQLGEFDVYNLGGGLGAKYTYTDHPPSIEEHLDVLVKAAERVLPSTSRIVIEPGRSLVAECGVTLYRVITVKRTERTVVAVDGGMSDNLEVSLYGQRFEATITSRVGGGELCSLVGRHCESGDQLIDVVALRDPGVGDLIAVPVTGAYCHTMANNYNGTRRPPIVFVGHGTAREVLRRETYEDLLRRDVS
jgi:diaminopimelate decarboxylase